MKCPDTSRVPFLPRLALLIGAAALAPAMTAQAQAQASAQKPPEPALSIPVSPDQAQQEIETRQKLNSEQADFAARQIAENEASRRMVEQAIMDRNATIARQQAEQEAAEQAYDAAQQAYEAERLRRVQEHDAAMARWRADVAACNAGDASRCAVQR